MLCKNRPYHECIDRFKPSENYIITIQLPRKTNRAEIATLSHLTGALTSIILLSRQIPKRRKQNLGSSGLKMLPPTTLQRTPVSLQVRNRSTRTLVHQQQKPLSHLTIVEEPAPSTTPRGSFVRVFDEDRDSNGSDTVAAPSSSTIQAQSVQQGPVSASTKIQSIQQSSVTSRCKQLHHKGTLLSPHQNFRGVWPYNEYCS
jgi:hypothetical protein